MNATNHSILKTELLLCCALLLALTGCTTYVEETPVRTVYAAPPPIEQPAPPPVVEAPAPPMVFTPPAPPPPPPVPDTAVVEVHAESDFYEPLTPYGEWVVVGSYGRCWRPLRVEAGWRPYCNGNWQRTDAGWYWVTDEPWGWATYHYGRWDWAVNLGWIWVPQTQWAPSWVAWREGAGYIGWAPLPPTATIAVGGGVGFRDAAYAPRAFVFVEERHLLERVRPLTVIVNNTTVINKTVNITKIQIINKTVVNEGPRPDVIERVTGRKIQPVASRELRHQQEAAVVARRPNIQRNTAPAAGRTKSHPPQAEVQPARGVLPRQAPMAERTATTANPATPGARANESLNGDGGKRPTKPAGAELEKPPRKARASEPVPALSKPAAPTEPGPKIVPRAPPAVQKPQPALANKEQEVRDQQRMGEAAHPKVQAVRETPTGLHSPAHPLEPASEKAAPAKKTPAQPKNAQMERPLKSPKDRAAAVHEAGANGQPKHPVKPGEQPEAPQKPGGSNP